MTEALVADAGGATSKMVDTGGFIQPLFMKPPAETKEVFESVPKFKFREDDLMLCTFAKTGKFRHCVDKKMNDCMTKLLSLI